MCLPSDALLQHLPSYLGFSYLGRGVSLHSCSSKVQPMLLTLDEGYLLTAAPPNLERGVAPLGPPASTQPPLLGRGVSPPGCRPQCFLILPCPWFSDEFHLPWYLWSHPHPISWLLKQCLLGTSLVVQRLRIHLAMEGKWIRSLVGEDST